MSPAIEAIRNRATRHGNRFRPVGVATVVTVNAAQGRAGASAAFAAAGLLVSGAALVGIGGLVGVVHTADRSPLGVASGAVWVVLLPGIVALVISGWRPALGPAFSAGAGLLAVSRLISDLTLVADPDTTIRPEFFYEVTDTSQPFTAAGGAALVVAGDLMMVFGGVLAAHRLARSRSTPAERFFRGPSARFTGVRPDGSGDPAVGRSDSGPGLLAEALESAVRAGRGDPAGFGARPVRNNWLILAGFVGVLGLLIASLGLGYRGGYLAARYLPPGLDLWGIAAALALAVLGTVAVLSSAVLARQLVVALLGGVALTAAVPFLTAIAVKSAAAPVQLNPTVGLGLAGAVVLAAAGLLSRINPAQRGGDEPTGAAVRPVNIAGAALTLAVAGTAALAWRLPQLRYNGGPDPKLADGYAISSPLGLPFTVGMVVALIGGLLWLIPPLAGPGRAVASVAWLAGVVAVTQSLDVLGAVVASASVPNGAFAPPTWTAGPGLWWGIVGVALGVAALTMTVTAGRRAADASPLIADEQTLGAARRIGSVVAAVLTVITVFALALPAYRTTDGAAATLAVGFRVNSWGVLALAVGMVVAAWAAGRATSAGVAIAYALAGAGIVVVRLIIPAGLRAQDGFDVRPGLVAGYVAAAAFVVAAAVLAWSAGRIRLVEPVPTPAALRPVARGARGPGVRGRVAARKGRRPGA